VPTASFRHAQPDDLFWAARRVMAFGDDMIRALVHTAGFSDPAAEQHLAHVLIQRRDKIGAAYLIAVHPLVNFALSPAGRLSFENAAAAAGIAAEPRGGYQLRWERFDNATGAVAPIGESTIDAAGAVDAPGTLPDAPDAFVSVTVGAVQPPYDAWAPVRAYFHRLSSGWVLVGIDRSGT
jgi:hypothetical protein